MHLSTIREQRDEIDDRTARFLVDLRTIEARYLVGISGVTRTLLIRHADAYQGLTRLGPGLIDPPLSDVGRHQAMLLAERIRTLRPCEVWSSDLRRAAETAAIVAAALPGTPLHLDDRLREAVGRHDVVGLSDAAVEVVRRTATAARLADAMADAEERATRSARPVVVVSHADAITAYLGHVLGWEGAVPMLPGFTSVSVVLRKDDRRIVESIGDVSHLACPQAAVPA